MNLRLKVFKNVLENAEDAWGILGAMGVLTEEETKEITTSLSSASLLKVQSMANVLNTLRNIALYEEKAEEEIVPFSHAYNDMSGVDLFAYFGEEKIARFQTVSYSIYKIKDSGSSKRIVGSLTPIEIFNEELLRKNPFDIKLEAANEYGGTSKMEILGARLLQEGWNPPKEINLLELYQYVAVAIRPWSPVLKRDGNI